MAALAALMLLALAVGCGGESDDGEAGATTAGADAVTATSGDGSVAPGEATPVEWEQLVADAREEGSVVLYTAQNPESLEDTAREFEARYGISVTVNRNIDSVTATQVAAEFDSGNHTADVWVTATQPHVLDAVDKGWVVPAVGPSLFADAYDRETLARPGDAAIVGAAVLGMAWNTQAHEGELKDIPDLLEPALKGRIGIPEPAAASFVDWYLWLEETYGEDILEDLAAQEPKIYASSLPMLQAVASGELAASPFVPGTALDLKEQGAPLEFLVPGGEQAWNAPFWGMVLDGAPHPAAAQLLIDYLVTREGQASSQHLSGAILPDVPEAFTVEPREQDLEALTPAKVAEFQKRWNELFRS
jgi:iron(III) transport system substrate-binding protein